MAEHFFGNSKPKTTTTAALLTDPVFMRGYDEVWQGLPFNPDHIARETGCRWAYERGRQFAVLQMAVTRYQKFQLVKPCSRDHPEGCNSYAIDLWQKWRRAGWLF
jgi:hypothetical protein